MATPSVVMGKTGRNYTTKQKKLLKIFYQGQGKISAKEAARQAGYAQWSEYAAIGSLKDEIMELTEYLLIDSAPQAATTLNEVMNSEEAITQVAAKLDAAKTILDRTGLGKKEKLDVTHEVSGGIFLIPAKKELVIEHE